MRKNTTHCNTEHSIVERKKKYIYNIMKGCEPYYTLTCIGILGKIRTGAPVWPWAEISKIRSWKYAKHSLKSRSANCINITKNNLEFVVCECRNRTCSGLVDMNVIKREDRHRLKCKGLTVEWQFLWNIITVVIPVWIGANRIIPSRPEIIWTI